MLEIVNNKIHTKVDTTLVSLSEGFPQSVAESLEEENEGLSHLLNLLHHHLFLKHVVNSFVQILDLLGLPTLIQSTNFIDVIRLNKQYNTKCKIKSDVFSWII